MRSIGAEPDPFERTSRAEGEGLAFMFLAAPLLPLRQGKLPSNTSTTS